MASTFACCKWTTIHSIYCRLTQKPFSFLKAISPYCVCVCVCVFLLAFKTTDPFSRNLVWTLCHCRTQTSRKFQFPTNANDGWTNTNDGRKNSCMSPQLAPFAMHSPNNTGNVKHNVTTRRDPLNITAVEKQYHIFWVCVCSLRCTARNANAPYCNLWPVRLDNIFLHCLINGTILGKKKSLNIKCVFWFSLQLSSESFLIIKIIQLHIITNVHSSSCEVPVILVRL